MSWDLTEKADGTWDWSFFQSAYGCAGGNEPTKNQAIVELLIGEAAVMESPYTPSVIRWMRANPDEVASDFDDDLTAVHRTPRVAHNEGDPWPRKAS